MNRLSANKKIVFLIAGFVLVTAAIIGVLFIVSSTPAERKPIVSDSTSDLFNSSSSNDEVGSQFYEQSDSVVNQTSTTSAQIADSPAMKPIIDATEAEIIEAYITARYYMSAVMYADGVPTDMDIAIRGQDFHTTINIDGINMGLMYLNNKIYLINSDSKKFIDFESIASLVGGQVNMDFSELKEVTAVLDMTQYNFYKFDNTMVDFNGTKAKRYTYYSEEMSLHFYFVNGELKQIDFGEPSGDTTTSISVNRFSPSIPSNMLTLIGLKKATVFDFFGEDLLKELQ